MNQSANQPANQPTNQPTNANRCTSQPTNQPLPQGARTESTMAKMTRHQIPVRSDEQLIDYLPNALGQRAGILLERETR